MQKDELVLSDVHIQINSCPSQKHHGKVTYSTLVFMQQHKDIVKV